MHLCSSYYSDWATRINSDLKRQSVLFHPFGFRLTLPGTEALWRNMSRELLFLIIWSGGGGGGKERFLNSGGVLFLFYLNKHIY